MSSGADFLGALSAIASIETRSAGADNNIFHKILIVLFINWRQLDEWNCSPWRMLLLIPRTVLYSLRNNCFSPAPISHRSLICYWHWMLFFSTYFTCRCGIVQLFQLYNLSPSHFILALRQSCFLSTVVLINEYEWIACNFYDITFSINRSTPCDRKPEKKNWFSFVCIFLNTFWQKLVIFHIH